MKELSLSFGSDTYIDTGSLRGSVIIAGEPRGIMLVAKNEEAIDKLIKALNAAKENLRSHRCGQKFTEIETQITHMVCDMVKAILLKYPPHIE